MNKKKLPLSILQHLEPFVDMKDAIFTVEHVENKIIVFKDKDPKSEFFFQIDEHEVNKNNGEEILTVKFAPKSDKEVISGMTKVRAGYLGEVLNNWINTLENYNKVKSFYDDPITQAYQAEFISSFEIVDEDAAREPLSIENLILLDDFLQDVNTRLIGMSDDSNHEQVQVIATQISEIRENLSSRSKKWVFEKVSRVYAQIAKLGVKFIKEFWTEGKKEIIKAMIKFAIESGQDMMN